MENANQNKKNEVKSKYGSQREGLGSPKKDFTLPGMNLKNHKNPAKPKGNSKQSLDGMQI